MRPSFAMLLALPVALAGCSGLSREDRIAAGLERAGVAPRLARCMAPELASDLSDPELARLAEAAKPPAGEADAGGRKAIMRRIEAMGDPHISGVVARVGIGCAILG